MTVYRRAEDVDVVERIKKLVKQRMLVGDLVACRERARIVEAQVKEALDGSLQAAKFCQDRAWHQVPIFPSEPPTPAIGQASIIAMWQEKIDDAESVAKTYRGAQAGRCVCINRSGRALGRNQHKMNCDNQYWSAPHL